jgi:hypothetical protein
LSLAPGCKQETDIQTPNAALHFYSFGNLPAVIDLGGGRQRWRSTGMQRGNALHQSCDWSEYKRDEKEDQRHVADGADQRTVGSFVQPHQIIVLTLPARVAGIVLRFEVLYAEHVVGSGDIRKQGCDDECDPDNVKPAGFRRSDV